MILWLIAGIAAGGAQATLLSFSAGGRSRFPAFLARIAVVAAILLLAVRAGHLVPAALGWVIGFAAASALALRRLPGKTVPPAQRRGPTPGRGSLP
ncbi:MAG TPA: hypothetical protein VMB50_17465 [Myxococcales bacterium]|nr:hypothetical protein [Myxococcales bacterium]